MISDDAMLTYNHESVLVVPDVLGAETLAQLRHVPAETVVAVASITAHTDVYDLEPGHTPASPRVRRINTPHKVHPVLGAVVRTEAVLDILKRLIGPALRLHGTKLSMKAARYGSPVEDWAFYPHTNDDVLVIGALPDDIDLANGPMLVTRGAHIGPISNHHGEEGRFAGLIDPDAIRAEIGRAVPSTGPLLAGAASGRGAGARAASTGPAPGLHLRDAVGREGALFERAV